MFTDITPDYKTLTLSCGTKVFSVIYRPPSEDVANFFLFLKNFFDFVNTNNYIFILGGDLNIGMAQHSLNMNQLSNLLISNGLQM